MTEKVNSCLIQEDTVIANEEHEEVTDALDPEYEKLLQTDSTTGLSDKEVEERLARFGRNGIL